MHGIGTALVVLPPQRKPTRSKASITYCGSGTLAGIETFVRGVQVDGAAEGVVGPAARTADLAAAIGAGGRRHAVMIEPPLVVADIAPDVVERSRQRRSRPAVKERMLERLLVVVHLERRHDLDELPLRLRPRIAVERDQRTLIVHRPLIHGEAPSVCVRDESLRRSPATEFALLVT